jgi:hypothetical protein
MSAKRGTLTIQCVRQTYAPKIDAWRLSTYVCITFVIITN